MTCIHISVHPLPIRSASSAREPERASWLAEDIRPGPRSLRIRSLSAAACGLAQTTGLSWMNVGGLDMETRQAFHEAHLLARRKALIGTLAHLRRKHRSTCEAMADLRAVTHELLAMGGP